MTLKFYTKEWLDEVRKALATNNEYQNKAKSLTFKNQYLLTDFPDGKDRLATFTLEEGQLVAYTLEDKLAPSDWRTMRFDDKTYFMKVTGSYSTFGKLNSGELSTMEAVMKKVYKIEGSMMKIMPKMGAIQAMATVMSSIPVEY